LVLVVWIDGTRLCGGVSKSNRSKEQNSKARGIGEFGMGS
jgi:hypothetical protein